MLAAFSSLMWSGAMQKDMVLARCTSHHLNRKSTFNKPTPFLSPFSRIDKRLLRCSMELGRKTAQPFLTTVKDHLQFLVASLQDLLRAVELQSWQVIMGS